MTGADYLFDTDPRFDPDRWYLPADVNLGFVHIAAHPEFRIGTRREQVQRVAQLMGHEIPEDEINDALTPVTPFHIGKYPVTVAQFGAFVAATGFEIGDTNALRDPPSRPVRFVSWHEALAYCAWLHQQLATASLLAGHPLAALIRSAGLVVSLPSELEWEVAARGGLGDAIFPWGSVPDPNRANYFDSSVGNTSAVGCFAPNGFGLHDMVGNVWEWTRSQWASYPYDPADGREDLSRVATRGLRGGSFFNLADNARCAYRNWNDPGFRHVIIGFRVVLRGPPVA